MSDEIEKNNLAINISKCKTTTIIAENGKEAKIDVKGLTHSASGVQHET